MFSYTPIQSLIDCTVKQCFLEDMRYGPAFTQTRVSKINCLPW